MPQCVKQFDVQADSPSWELRRTHRWQSVPWRVYALRGHAQNGVDDPVLSLHHRAELCRALGHLWGVDQAVRLLLRAHDGPGRPHAARRRAVNAHALRAEHRVASSVAVHAAHAGLGQPHAGGDRRAVDRAAPRGRRGDQRSVRGDGPFQRHRGVHGVVVEAPGHRRRADAERDVPAVRSAAGVDWRRKDHDDWRCVLGVLGHADADPIPRTTRVPVRAAHAAVRRRDAPSRRAVRGRAHPHRHQHRRLHGRNHRPQAAGVPGLRAGGGHGAALRRTRAGGWNFDYGDDPGVHRRVDAERGAGRHGGARADRRQEGVRAAGNDVAAGRLRGRAGRFIRGTGRRGAAAV